MFSSDRKSRTDPLRNDEAQTTVIAAEQRTHVGNRTENQDRASRFLSPFGEVFLVADGMSGRNGGAIAADMAVERFEAFLNSMDGVPAGDALLATASRVNAEIHERAHSGDPETNHMATTAVLAVVNGNQLIVGHAGDSRAYLFREGRLSRLTRDDSVIQKMLDHKILTQEEARVHPDAGVITQALGLKPQIEFEVSTVIDLQEGDRILLCTDGLCGYVEDAVLESIMNQPADAGPTADKLLQAALDGGGEDNITLQFIQFSSTGRLGFNRARRVRERWLPVVLGAVLALVLLGFILWFLQGRHSSLLHRGRQHATKAGASFDRSHVQPGMKHSSN
jgi:serine/threonine protein phosphatase PrpC